MNYCVLVEINKFTINFSYYTDGTGRFEPFDKDEPAKPLAVWFSGNSVIIGEDAKREAKRDTPNAFYDLLGWMQKQGHFDYANEKHEYNKLILYTIRAGLRDFYSRILLNSEGSLDENMSHIPLLVTMGADIKDNESAVIVNQLHDNGFGNVHKIDFDRFIVEADRHADDSCTHLILSGYGDDVIAKIYSRGHEDKFLLRNAGRDPRVDKLADLIWNRTQAENNFLVFDDEIEELRRAAKAFIYSGESEVNRNIVLSDGNEYPYFLTNEDMRLFNKGESSLFLNELINHVSQYATRQKCRVVLKGVLATNKYLSDILRPEFPYIKLLEKDDIRDVLNKIIEWCRTNNFKFAKGSRRTATPSNGNVSQNTSVSLPEERHGQKAATGPSKRDERDFNILKKQVEAHKNSSEYDKALDITKEFIMQMAAKGLTCFDSETEKMKAELEELANRENSVSPGDERKFKHLERIVAMYVNKGDFSHAIEEIDNLSKDFAKKGVNALVRQLAQIKGEVMAMMRTKTGSRADVTASKRKTTAAKTPSSPKADRATSAKKEDEGILLMREGKYKEARDKFRADNRKAEANDCTEIIKWQRLFATYKAEVASISQTGNKAKAKSRMDEIRTYVSLYKKYGIDTTELMRTIKELEKIK